MPKTVSNIIIIIVISFILLGFAKTVSAQDFTAAKAYKDYQYQQSNYLQAESNYNEAKTFYKKNPTLQLREEARKKTLELLINRDQLMVVYLTAIRIQLVETTGLTNDEKGSLFSNLDPEIAWYQNHINGYNGGDDLNTLFTKSDESKAHYQKSTKAIVYNSLFDITLSQEIGFKTDHQAIYSDLKNVINDQVSQGKIKIDPFNRWLSDTDSILQILAQNETLGKNKIPTFYSLNYNLNSTYDSAVQIVRNSVSPLKQLNNYLTEMLIFIKSQQ